MISMYTGVSGMKAYQQAVDVIANNVANIDTVAFKAGRATFEETLARTISGGSATGVNPMQLGMGVSVGSIDTWMQQGSFRTTDRTLDLAIDGEGFFVVSDGGTLRFTRDGVSQLDQQNRLVTANSGLPLLGWQADLATGTLNTSTPPVPQIIIPLGAMYAVPTSKVFLGGNLDATAAAGANNASFTTYDSLGHEHTVALAFTETAANTWSWTATSADGTMLNGSGTGTVTFDSTGHVTGSTGTIEMAVTPANGSNPLQVALDFSRVSQLAGEGSIQAKSQDGLPLGVLQGFSIEDTGIISGSFSNGAARVLGQIALATMSNPAGMMRLSNNLWSTGPNTGIPIIQTPPLAGGKIRSGSLEMSNVDLANEFANLITTQRAYQANSRSITTADEMMQDLLQLKR